MSCTEIYSYTFCNNLALAILLGGVFASSYWFRRAYRSFFPSRRRYRQRPYRPRYRKQNRSRYGARRYQTVETKKVVWLYPHRVKRPSRRSIREVSTEWRLVVKIRYRSFLVLLLGLYTGTSAADDRPSGIPDGARWVKVDRVTDGDTIVLMDRRRIRLHGIDAPEQDQPYGSVATAALKYMVGRSVYLVATDTDRYGRTVAQLYHSKEGYDINASMVCAGYAWWYERYAPDNRLLEGCENEAREAPKGLWEDKDPMPPWVWRRR